MPMAAAIDHNSGLLGVESFPADRAGCESLLGWLVDFDPVIRAVWRAPDRGVSAWPGFFTIRGWWW